ncbi:Beta-glucuronidase [Hyphodiscus hymeniophilus]|uniref:Beta-glucuronidase n=1 Tax=Hyphodiscus hymeniophilus TaxID=353542 RepID=A0A9P6VD65_9HELO|nr:Beta-glucuronidase [Hyphodiscus hymeniophilus]
MASSKSSISYLLPFLLSLTQSAAAPTLSQSPPSDAVPLSPYLNSFSIEFENFPVFAGNATHPNQFSINILRSLAERTGVMPMIRVGGTTEDDAHFIQNQTEPVIVIGATNGTRRAGVTIGPSFFSSYGTFPATTYIPSITLAVNGSEGIETRQAETAYISQALGDSLAMMEIGNEPDLFQYWNRRPSTWNVTDYVEEWLNANKVIESTLAKNNPELAKKVTFFAPSFAGTDIGSSLDSIAPLAAFAHGLNSGNNIKVLSGHNYMGSATGAGVTLQSTLMNHTSIVRSIASHVTLAKELQKYCSAPYVMGETNSLSGGGASGLSNVFGAALWVVDYTLWQATQNIQRVHFHNSATSPYAAWSPSTSPPTTNAPYYGNVMVASAVGLLPDRSIAYLDLGNNDERTSAYTIYSGSNLVRVVILNMVEYLSTSSTARPTSTFSVNVPKSVKGALVERLTAAGADALSGITIGGLSYDYSRAEGKPVLVNAKAALEEVSVKNGVLSVTLQASEGAVLHLF